MNGLPAGLSGLITDELGEILYELARTVPGDWAIVELGSFEGKSTAYLAAGARDGDGPLVVAVDLWDDPRNTSKHRHRYGDPAHRARFEEQLSSLDLRWRVDARQSDTAVAGQSYTGPRVGLLYVDADHSENGVRRDLAAWSRHLAAGAIVAFDDYGTPKNPGVKKVVDSLGRKVSVMAGQLAVIEWGNE